jgi:flavodoxin
MTKAVRYYSRLGNTKTIAEAIAEGAGVKAVSVTDEPGLTQRVDVLYLGGAPYANIMAPELKAYAEKLESSKVGKWLCSPPPTGQGEPFSL